MKKTIIAGSAFVLAGCLLCACGGGEGGSSKVKVEPKPPPAEKVAPPESAISQGLKSGSDGSAAGSKKPK
jgi:hypothetical protein